MSEIKEANSDYEIEMCFPLILELRPHLVREKFVEQVNEQRSQGYRLAYLKQEGIEMAAMGFRILKFAHLILTLLQRLGQKLLNRWVTKI